METGEQPSLVVLLQALNCAILASFSELVPALQNHRQASQLRQDSERLQIWSNDLGMESAELQQRLRGEQELEYSIATLHILIAQGLIVTEKCLPSKWKGELMNAAAVKQSIYCLGQAIAALESRYPQFSEQFSTRSNSIGSQSVGKSNRVPNSFPDSSDSDAINALEDSLAEVSATVDRLLRLAPFLEQYLRGSADATQDIDDDSLHEATSKEAGLYLDRILTRFPQASKGHVRILADARQHIGTPAAGGSRRNLLGVEDGSLNRVQTSHPEAALHLPMIERSVIDDKEIPYPSLPQRTHGGLNCTTCGDNFLDALSTTEWRTHTLNDYKPYTCLEATCPYDTRSFNSLLVWFAHSCLDHDDKPQWTCRLCGARRFAAKSQLQYHAETVHYIPAEAAMGLCELWQGQVAAQEEESECIFCNETYGDEKFARIGHLGRHMVEIAFLMPLPAVGRENAGNQTPAAIIPSKEPLTKPARAPAYRNPRRSIQATPPFGHYEPFRTALQFRLGRPVVSNKEDSGLRESSGDDEMAFDESDEEESEEESVEPESSDEEDGSEMHYDSRVTKVEMFILEELSDESADSGADIAIVYPYEIEDADDIESSKKARAQLDSKKEVLDRLNEVRCEENTSDEEEQERMYYRKKKRWSAGIFKRTHSQSVEGDSSYSDNDPLDDVDLTARRLRRRVRGTDGRGSLIFSDKGFPNDRNIVELEEPDEEVAMVSKGPPSIPSDDAFTLDELPFWKGYDVSMELDIEPE